MVLRARALVTTCAVAVALITAASAFAQDKDKKQPKYSKEQQAEAQAIIAVADAVQAGTQQAPAEIKLTLQNHYMRSREGKTFVPFTLIADPAQLTTPSVLLYVRAVAKGQAAPIVASTDKDKKKAPRPEYPWEDFYFIDVKPAPGQTEPYRIQRALVVPAGEYDLYIGLRLLAPAAAGKKDSKAPAAPPTTFVKQTVTVPDFSTNFALSSILALQKIEDLPEFLSEQQAREQPYTFGKLKLTPWLENKFTKKDEFSLMFWLYNSPLDATSQKPNITIDYSFLKKAKAGDKYDAYKRTAPRLFNAETLPPTWDGATMNQLLDWPSVSLESFEPGEYRCEIKVTDKVTNKTLTEYVTFSVGA